MWYLIMLTSRVWVTLSSTLVCLRLFFSWKPCILDNLLSEELIFCIFRALIVICSFNFFSQWLCCFKEAYNSPHHLQHTRTHTHTHTHPYNMLLKMNSLDMPFLFLWPIQLLKSTNYWLFTVLVLIMPWSKKCIKFKSNWIQSLLMK